MGDNAREPFDPGEGPQGADERLRDRVAAARTSLGEVLREASKGSSTRSRPRCEPPRTGSAPGGGADR